jgi:hypothetical protein
MKESIYSNGQVEDKGDNTTGKMELVTSASVKEKNGHLDIPNINVYITGNFKFQMNSYFQTRLNFFNKVTI